MDANDRNRILLVDEQDRPLRFEDKIPVHERATLHRAFSIFVFDGRGRMLLQLRSRKKEAFGGLWTNACCGHHYEAYADRPLVEVAGVRLPEEFGFSTAIREKFTFIYQAKDPGSRFTEHELDHVFVGRFDGTPSPNPDEIDDYRWIEPAELLRDVEVNRDAYSPWFKIAVGRVLGEAR